jgi:hypothetical protein
VQPRRITCHSTRCSQGLTVTAGRRRAACGGGGGAGWTRRARACAAFQRVPPNRANGARAPGVGAVTGVTHWRERLGRVCERRERMTSTRTDAECVRSHGTAGCLCAAPHTCTHTPARACCASWECALSVRIVALLLRIAHCTASACRLWLTSALAGSGAAGAGGAQARWACRARRRRAARRVCSSGAQGARSIGEGSIARGAHCADAYTIVVHDRIRDHVCARDRVGRRANLIRPLATHCSPRQHFGSTAILQAWGQRNGDHVISACWQMRCANH